MWFLPLILLLLKVVPSLEVTQSQGSKGLFLSKLIEQNKIVKAREASKVNFFMRHAGVEAHSGYITVREKSHLFFLLLKAPKKVFDKAPLILWLQGGPGRSGLFGQFLENGPVGLDAKGRLYNRSCAFQNEASVLYVDYPAGGGFSIIQDSSVFSSSLTNVTDDLLSFLTQFYKLFYEFKTKDLYFAGESYGAGTFFNFKIGGKPSVFSNMTGYSDQGSILHAHKPSQISQYEKYANTTKFKQALHIPVTVSLEKYRLPIQLALAPNDYFTDISDTFKRVLNRFKVLIVNGQMDNIFPAVLFDEYLSKIHWGGAAEFNAAPRVPWQTFKAPHQLAGYVKESKKLVNAFVLKAGHHVGSDECDAVYDLVCRFINNIYFVNA
ncbi:hypothetical protein V5799_018452 [Amblyomma americanum]|uniref:Serine carboxypeptidase n=1 Tax=Amblyomma americanum TaxID=6943 RepID=A0AAQ4F0E1_AMBAM